MPSTRSAVRLRTPIKIFGGKHYLARRIAALIPPHDTYLEPFLGGGSVLLAKSPSRREIACDLNPAIVSFWSVLGGPDGDRLIDLARGASYDEATFDVARILKSDPDPILRAYATLVRNRFSYAGLGEHFSRPGKGKSRLRGGLPDNVNSWKTIRELLPAIRERVRGVEWYCCDATSMIRAFGNGRGVVIYLDPPYQHGSRTDRDSYGAFEMTDEEHVRLIGEAEKVNATVLMSGYRNDLYDTLLGGWRRVEWDLPCHAAGGRKKERRTECLWIK